MSSGERRIRTQNLYQADASRDVIRLQDIIAQGRNAALQALIPAELQGPPISNPGLVRPFQALPSDVIPHQIFSGLLVRPDNSTFLTVDPGVAAFYNPSFTGIGADDSPWILVDDPGTTDPATLTYLSNAGPGVRWDIVECQAGADTVTEQATIPIFDPTAQQFNPTANQPVVSRSSITYRIRRGTAGGGIPDPDPNWCPLAAVHVRADSTSFANSDVYDIRPLNYERSYRSAGNPLQLPAGSTNERIVLREAAFSTFSSGGVNGLALAGYFLGDFGGYWSGGRITHNLPAANAGAFGDTNPSGPEFPGLNLENALARSGGFSLTANSVMVLGAFFPRGYPRWVRYSQSPIAANTQRIRSNTGLRFPFGPRGILMALAGADGGGIVQRNGLISPAPLPAAMGETANAWGHVVQYAIVDNGGTKVFPARGAGAEKKYSWQDRNFVNTGGYITSSYVALVNGPAIGSFTVGNSGGTTPTLGQSVSIDVTNGSDNIPKNAEEVLLEVKVALTVAAGLSVNHCEIWAAASGGTQVLYQDNETRFINSGGSPVVYTEVLQFWFPLRVGQDYDGGALQTQTLAIQFGGDVGAFTANASVTACRVHGYRF